MTFLTAPENDCKAREHLLGKLLFLYKGNLLFFVKLSVNSPFALFLSLLCFFNSFTFYFFSVSVSFFFCFSLFLLFLSLYLFLFFFSLFLFYFLLLLFSWCLFPLYSLTLFFLIFVSSYFSLFSPSTLAIV